MDKTDRPAFARLFSGLAQAFRTEASEDMMRGYWMGLDDLPLADVSRGVARCLRECKFMPAPVEIRNRASATPNDGPTQALLAWERWKGGERTGGTDPVARKTVASLGGWERIGQMESEYVDTKLRGEFLRVYAMFYEKRDGLGIGAGSGDPDVVSELAGNLAERMKLE